MASAFRIVVRDDALLTAADRRSLGTLSNAVHPPGARHRQRAQAMPDIGAGFRYFRKRVLI
jgi:hypothetical protein